jgi:hypothetical protein
LVMVISFLVFLWNDTHIIATEDLLLAGPLCI